ncbi:hypothetical protein CTheo_5944 [Ceratobasidium theobromae]|uniref:Uncharacterized protein n=1 Tax=Ceratobasidium theobromae TaxID=1582974 RepID=A0A5N5QGL8_9AGAM|nr:hypothetical protein CTheo_5944 [Ceratobasidium theobromae]
MITVGNLQPVYDGSATGGKGSMSPAPELTTTTIKLISLVYRLTPPTPAVLGPAAQFGLGVAGFIYTQVFRAAWNGQVVWISYRTQACRKGLKHAQRGFVIAFSWSCCLNPLPHPGITSPPPPCDIYPIAKSLIKPVTLPKFHPVPQVSNVPATWNLSTNCLHRYIFS